ncbi:LON peptidase substrate-binding domain-containing protein [Paracoccus sulfuroxidans]|uniref:Lon N-terminal domain-containing protein n=1 Tax=Paracoccus sulfuroxidans TaxID=384678 RepID=A0A562NP30_9RHOB|nr:LON peptidase substrate-binding domain-containing protein [Paracoccus sulfuroxidans]TWI33830.1 hypothetical protein IQ24_02194 [Paracoccus sulfuroxidans]
MVRAFDLTETLALFPLQNAILMPRGRLPLQIYEPRYLQMVEDVLKTPQRLIGMIQPAEGGLEHLSAVGCAGRIVSFMETEDGRLMVTLRAVSRFRLLEVLPGFTPYLRARIDWKGYRNDRLSTAEEDLKFDRTRFLERLERYLDERGLVTDWDVAAQTGDEMLINSLSMMLPLQVEEKQALLECRTLAERRELLDGLLEYALRGGDNEEVLQ